MGKFSRSSLFWTPKILGLLFALFLGLFSLDVLEYGGDFWSTLAGFLLHNIPSIVLILAIVLGWRREWMGGVGFVVIGIWLFSVSAGRDWWFITLFAGVPFFVATLFLIGWITRKNIPAQS